MQSFYTKAFLVLIFAGCFAVPTMAWDDVGHKITAYIAWQQMTPDVREAVIKTLREAPEDSQLATFYMSYGAEPELTRKREFFEIVATWADIVRDRDFKTRLRKYHQSNWHYSDTFWKQVDGKAEVLTGFPEGGQAVAKLYELEKTLRNPQTANEQKAIAIAWLIHLSGDIHQPLHTSARVTDTEPKGDQGGNLFLLTPDGTKRADQVALHWYWDSIVGRNNPLKGDICDRNYIELIGNQMMKSYPFARDKDRLELGKYDDWQSESFKLNVTYVFSNDLARNKMPSAKYQKTAYKIAERQLTLAGYRLGQTMNSIFGGGEK